MWCWVLNRDECLSQVPAKAKPAKTPEELELEQLEAEMAS